MYRDMLKLTMDEKIIGAIGFDGILRGRDPRIAVAVYRDMLKRVSMEDVEQSRRRNLSVLDTSDSLTLCRERR
jgi:hypothetical protein